jgi:hypothetical protein
MDFTIRLTGTEALLMHNVRLANPLDPMAKELKLLTGKRTKTDEDHEAIARAEFLAGLYYDDIAGPYIPADNLWRALWDAAKKSKSGVMVKEGLFISTTVNPLGYDGPRGAEDLWEDKDGRFRHYASAKVGMQRVNRTRPMFPVGWTVEADGMLDTGILDLEKLRGIAVTAGSLIGLGDWRPRFGRFTAEVEKK